MKRHGKNFFKERYPQRAMTWKEPRVLQKLAKHAERRRRCRREGWEGRLESIALKC